MRNYITLTLLPIAFLGMTANEVGCTTTLEPISRSGGDAGTQGFDAGTSPRDAAPTGADATTGNDAAPTGADATTGNDAAPTGADACAPPIFCIASCPIGAGNVSMIVDGCEVVQCCVAVDAGDNVQDARDSEEASATDGGEAGVPSECSNNRISFGLTVWDSAGPVFPGFECDAIGWLQIAPAGGNPLNLVRGPCEPSCPVSQPEAATAQSYVWDGTYYTILQDCAGLCICDTPICAPPGNYVATMCVGYAGDAGAPETAPPTCKQIPFVWPPTSANESIVEMITPTPDGG
jgi:hypothetical protein